MTNLLNNLLICLDIRLNEITENSQIYDYCDDALDLIQRDKKASQLYSKICEIVNYETDNIEELNEILQTYDIEIKNYKKTVEENNK